MTIYIHKSLLSHSQCLHVMVYIQDDYDGKSTKMASEAVSALLLRPLKPEQRLKLSKTELLNVMEAKAVRMGYLVKCAYV